MNVKIELKPLGSKIKITVYGQPFCTRGNCNLAKSFTWSATDLVFKEIFGSKKEAIKFAGGSKPATKTVTMETLGFDPCDIIK